MWCDTLTHVVRGSSAQSIGDRHPAIRQVRRARAFPTLARTVFYVYLLVVPFAVWAYGADLTEYLAGVGLGAGVVLLSVYQVRSRHRRRRAMADRAVEVPIEPRDTHVVEDRPFNPGADARRVTYDWLVEYRYEHDGEQASSFFAYPDGVHEQCGTLDEAQRTAKSRLGRAGDTGYYDPETDQAFLYDRPNGDVYRSNVVAIGVEVVVLGAVLAGLYVLIFSPPLPV